MKSHITRKLSDCLSKLSLGLLCFCFIGYANAARVLSEPEIYYYDNSPSYLASTPEEAIEIFTKPRLTEYYSPAEIEWGAILSAGADLCNYSTTVVNGLPFAVCQQYTLLDKDGGPVVSRAEPIKIHLICPEGAQQLTESNGDNSIVVTCSTVCTDNSPYPICNSVQSCPPAHTLNPITNQCEARCSLGSTWDESTQKCVDNKRGQVSYCKVGGKPYILNLCPDRSE